MLLPLSALISNAGLGAVGAAPISGPRGTNGDLVLTSEELFSDSDVVIASIGITSSPLPAS